MPALAGVLFRMSRASAKRCIEGGTKRTLIPLVIPAKAGIQASVNFGAG